MQVQLKVYMANEKIQIEDDALAYITRLADGGMRDALSLLEKCISFYFDEQITLDKVLYLFGAVDTYLLFNMVDAFHDFDCKAAIAICEEVNMQGRSIRQFVNYLMVHFRNLLLFKITQADVVVLV